MEVAENPSQTSFCPHQAGSSPPAAILFNGLQVEGMSAAESISNIWSFMHSPPRIAAARNLRGEEAQGLIDLIDQVIALPELGEKLRKQCLHLLSKICKACEMLPASYILQQEPTCADNIRCYGGFSDVSEGEYLGRRVAIKYLRFRTKDTFNNMFKRFCLEIISWKRLSHPHVLPLLGVSVSADPRCFCIVSDWMRNGNVMEYTRSNPKVNRLRFLSQVMSGATYLHEVGVVHGDLKGTNILVDDDGAARIADFGLMATSIDLSTVPLSATTISTAGTIRWMSPELLFDQTGPPTRESDCYALGMVIYEVLTGRQPFRRLGPYAVVIAVQKGEHPSKPHNAESLGFSNTLWWWTRSCWSKTPSARPTAQQLFHCFQGASCTWVPPLEYPIPDVLSEGAGADLTSGGEQSVVMSALKSRLFVLVVGMLFVLLLPLT